MRCGGRNSLTAMAHFASIFEPNHCTRKIVDFDSVRMLTSAIGHRDGNRVIGHVPKHERVKGDTCVTVPACLD